MAILAFQKPDKVVMLEADNKFGKFEFRPLEPGFGVTIGNALRRILLSSLEGYAVKPGMVVGVREKAKSLEVIENALAGFNHSKYPWLEWDENTKSGKFLHKPERADIPENIKEQLIVELYSK